MLQDLVKPCRNRPESPYMFQKLLKSPDLFTFSIQMVVMVVEMVEVNVEMEEG